MNGHPPQDGSGSHSLGERRMSSGDAGYVSARAADALLSDLRPTTLQPQCLAYLNELLDELLSSIIQTSLGLETDKLKTQAISTIIPPPLGRDAVGEAELELLSWLDSEEGKASRGIKEIIYVASPGSAGEGQVWPWREAWELMRVMTQSYSTLGDRPPSDSLEQSFIAALTAAGGDARPAIIDPAALYLTAILEHVAEYVLGSLSRVMSTEQGLSTAGPKELYSALCEDEALYGMVKGMQIKSVIERAMQVSRRSTSSNAGSTTKKTSSSTSASFPSNYSVTNSASESTRPATLNGSTTRTIPHDFAASQPSSAEFRSSLDSSNGPISPPLSQPSKQSFSLGRKSTSSSRFGGSVAMGDGSSRETKTSMRSFEEEIEDERAEEERDFDDFLRGGKTMKLSLTPQSLKSNETYDRDSGPRRNRSLARRPVLAMEDQAQSTRGPSGGANGGGPPSSSSLRRNVSTQGGPAPRFAAREPTLRVDEDEEYEEDEEDIMMRGGKKQPRKESLAELLSSAPPWAGDSSAPARASKPNVTRSVPSSPAAPAAYRASPAQPPASSAALNKRLGIQEPVSSSPSPPDGGSPSPPLGSMRSSPSMPARSKFDSLSGQASPSASRPQARSPKSYEDDSDSDDELLGRKPKQRPLRSADLIAFLDGPPPSSMRQQPSQPNLADDFDSGTKSKKKGLRGLVSKLTGGGSAGSSSSPSSSKASDGLPPPSSYNSSTVRSNKSSAQQHQSSGSISSKNPVLRRSKSTDVSAGDNNFMPSSSNAPFVASTMEPISPRIRSKNQTGGSQSSIPSLDQAPPPLPSKTPLADVAPPARSSSRVRGSSSTATAAAPISTHPASASSRSSPRAPGPTPTAAHQRDPSLPTITRTSLADQESSVRPSISSIDAEAAPSRATRVALAGASLAPATILASPTMAMEVSPVPSEAPSFGFPSKLATPTEEAEPAPFEGREKLERRDADGFDALGMPIENVGPGPTATVAEKAEEATELAYAAVPVSTTQTDDATPIPSVPHSSLAHLRTLLAHATTADECRLLVGALLGRWGVPLAPSAEADEAERKREEQVGRMYGWLVEEYAGAAPSPAAEEEEEGSVYEEVEDVEDVKMHGKEEILQAGGVVVPEVREEEEEKEGVPLHGGEGAVL